ncbi:unnamed protein product [Amoebophrya sp. A25]|nr:unnamed protein product [Amoebophrya sp. A25]|eukprot:GSA25T00008864001.1
MSANVSEPNVPVGMNTFGRQAVAQTIGAGHRWGFAFTACTIFVSVVLCGSYLAKFLRGKISLFVLDLFNVGAAGMFLAMAMFHILPEVVVEILGQIVKGSVEGWRSRYMDQSGFDFNEQLGKDIMNVDVDDKLISFTSITDTALHEFERRLQLVGAILFLGYATILFFERVFALWFTPAPSHGHSHGGGCAIHDDSDEEDEEVDKPSPLQDDVEDLENPLLREDDFENPLANAFSNKVGVEQQHRTVGAPATSASSSSSNAARHHHHGQLHSSAASRHDHSHDDGACDHAHHADSHGMHGHGHEHGHGSTSFGGSGCGHDHSGGSGCGHDHSVGGGHHEHARHSHSGGRHSRNSHSHANCGRHSRRHSTASLGCHGHDNHGHQHGVPVGASPASAIMLMLALSIHCFFEGWSAASNFKGNKPWRSGIVAVTAYAAHKWVEGFVLALSLLKADFGSGSFFLFNFACSLASPLGVILYTASHAVAASQMKLVEPYFNAFACGTLLYVGVTEIIPEVFECDTAKSVRKALAKYLVFNACGGLLMLFLFFNHSCGGGDDGDGHVHCEDGSCPPDELLPMILKRVILFYGY